MDLSKINLIACKSAQKVCHCFETSLSFFTEFLLFISFCIIFPTSKQSKSNEFCNTRKSNSFTEMGRLARSDIGMPYKIYNTHRHSPKKNSIVVILIDSNFH